MVVQISSLVWLENLERSYTLIGLHPSFRQLSLIFVVSRQCSFSGPDSFGPDVEIDKSTGQDIQINNSIGNTIILMKSTWSCDQVQVLTLKCLSEHWAIWHIALWIQWLLKTIISFKPVIRCNPKEEAIKQYNYLVLNFCFSIWNWKYKNFVARFRWWLLLEIKGFNVFEKILAGTGAAPQDFSTKTGVVPSKHGLTTFIKYLKQWKEKFDR